VTPAQRRLLGVLTALAVVLAFFSATTSGALAAAPAKPRVTGDAAIVIDAKTGDVLYAKHAERPHAIASTTKLMTALLARERAGLSDIFTAPAYHAGAAETKLGLKKGERLTVKDLLEAMMLPSDNDAAATIAANVADSRSAFVKLMNQRAEQLGLDNTHYSTPIGLDDPGNYSTPHDLANLARVLIKDKAIDKIVDSTKATLESGAHPRVVVNRNRLVGAYPFVKGIKTGHTLDAGYCLVGYAVKGDVRVISVVLGTPSENARDSDSLALMKYGLAQFRHARVVDKKKVVAQTGVKYFPDDRIDVVPAQSLSLTIRRGERVSKRVVSEKQLEGPLPPGHRVGTLTVTYRSKVVRTIPLVTAEPVKGAGTIRKIHSDLGGAGTAVALLVLALLLGLAALRVNAVRRRGRRVARTARRR
jgi:D-alanyl-D-alanine carboxypeptidase (penicillin-binding protein 5/6)